MLIRTSYRLTEHHVGGAMSRWLPWLSELQPELFAEISEELAKPLFKGRTGLFFGAGTIGSGLILPLLACVGWKLTRKPTPSVLNIGASLMEFIGGMLLRYTWIVAGRASADDAAATHYYNAIERSER